MMKYQVMIYKVLSFLLVAWSMTACIDDDFVDNCPPELFGGGYFNEGYSLNVAVTLDNMGGTKGVSDDKQSLEYWENYIDLEKFRVLFFDNEDKFLFESKSRWVKQLEPGSNGNRWLVSVPLFTYGNDTYDEVDENGKVVERTEWNWKYIREKLTTDGSDNSDGYFKIAILANRPEREWCPGFADVPLATKGWFDNTGPNWTPKHTGNKTVFDLHHCQWDPIYHGKSTEGKDYYDFIMEDYDGSAYTDDDMKPKMGATSSWLDWTGTNKRGWSYKSSSGETAKEVDYVNYIHPDENHPIPMYGIQKFARIDSKLWQEGTPFNLSKDIPGAEDVNTDYKDKKSISLLRSVVKLELFIPKFIDDIEAKVGFVAMCYPNIYARCEPMDVWTPTDELWEAQHSGGEDNCEITSIKKYGTISKSSDNKDSTTPGQYKQRIGWLYGAWLDEKPGSGGKHWWFNDAKDGGTAVNFDLYTNKKYPRIFNPYIQRSSAALCDDLEVDDDPDYYHYVVYTGERNINDPSNLGKLGGNGGGAPTVQYWTVSLNGKYYAFPITDYSESGNLAFNIPQVDVPTPTMDNDLNKNVMSLTHSYVNGTYMQQVMDVSITDPDLLPWPLIRNHVYRLKLASKSLKKEPVILSWNEEPTLSSLTTDDMTDTGSSKNVATWSNGYSIMIMRSDKSQSSANKLSVNGKDHTTIKLSNGAQNKLILPKGKVTKKITLYSYVNWNVSDKGTMEHRDSYWEEVAGVHYTFEQTPMFSYMSNSSTVVGMDKYVFKFEQPLSEVTFTNAGEQCCYVIAIDVEDDVSGARGTENENAVGFTIKSEDLHSESIKFD